MSTLDNIRKLAEEAKIAEQELSQRQGELRERYAIDIQPTLEKVFVFLVEIEEHLNYLKPEILVDYNVPGFGQLSEMLQGDYHIPKGRRGVLERVPFTFACTSGQTLTRKIDNNERFMAAVEKLERDGLEFDSTRALSSDSTSQGGTIVIKGNVPVSIVLTGQLESSNIELSIKNYFDIGQIKSELKPEEIDQAFFDELGKFILREDNQFLTVRLSEEQRTHLAKMVKLKEQERQEQLRQITEAAAREEEALGREHKATSKLNSLVQKFKGLKALGASKLSSPSEKKTPR
jgi:hypothetical protein